MRNFKRNKDLKRRGAALVTGAARGLGFETAKRLQAYGYEVILSGRDGSALLSAAQKLGCRCYAADLSSEHGAKDLYNAVKNDGIKLSVLVNNAGLGASGEAWRVPYERDRELIEVNVAAATELSKLFLSDACERGFGKLMNVCSVGAFQPGPYTASYYASKAYLHSYTLALRKEAKAYGVSVCSLCPGPLDTGFFGSAGAKKPKNAMSPEKAADYAVKKFMKNKAVIIPGFANRLARLLPQSIKTAYVARIKATHK